MTERQAMKMSSVQEDVRRQALGMGFSAEQVCLVSAAVAIRAFCACCVLPMHTIAACLTSVSRGQVETALLVTGGKNLKAVLDFLLKVCE